MNRFKDSWGKAKILLSQLLCIGAMFTACTDDEVFNQTTKALQVYVSTESPAESRAIIDGGYLPDGASIGVTITAEDGTAYDGQTFTNLQYTAAGEGSAQTWSSATPASLSITAGKVIAYYPYYGGEDFDLKAVPVETASQTDYMYAKPVTGINMVSPAANLTMQHAMTDIRINIKKGTYTGTGEVTKITAKAPAFATSATMDVETGVFANVSGGGAQFVQELTGAAISSSNVMHDFLIVPDAKSTSGDVSIFVIIDGKKFAVTVPYTEAFQQGFAYTYNLTLDNAALTLDGVSVSKWGVKAEMDESLQFYDDQYIVEIQVPSDGYTYNHNIEKFIGTIDWGDGTIETYNSSTSGLKHTYTTAGNYIVTAEGSMYALDSYFMFDNNTNSFYPSKIITKLLRIGKEMGVTDMGRAFHGQKLLSEIKPDLFDGCTKVTTFTEVFRECTGISEIPEGLFDKCTEVTSFYGAFYKCSKISEIPNGLFDYNTKVTDFSNTFAECTKLVKIPSLLFKNNSLVKYFQGTFDRCSRLESIPEGLFDNCTEVTSFVGSYEFYARGCFSNCTKITFIPEGLFDKCTKVTIFGSDIESPVGIFYGCSNLTSIPEGLFDKCTEVINLAGAFANTGISEIPQGLFDYNTKVENFAGTFYDCESLISIPSGLFDNCTKVNKITHKNFYGIFYHCTNLQTIPEGLFDAFTNVTNNAGVFKDCKSLQTVPAGLFDKCTEVTSFFETFYGCTNLNNIPAGLFDKNTKVTNFTSTFRSCSSLTTIPEKLFDYNTKVTDFTLAFIGCSSLQAIPSGLFDNCPEITSFKETFYGCKNLTSIPEGLFDYNTKVTNFGSTFAHCYSLQAIPQGLFDNCPEVTSFAHVFGSDTYSESMSILNIPEGLFDKNTKVTSFGHAFYKNTKLQAIPSGLFDKCTEVTDFYAAFCECYNLKGESPYTVINVDGVDTKVHLYERENYPEYFTAPTSYGTCFKGDTYLTDYSSIPPKWINY